MSAWMCSFWRLQEKNQSVSFSLPASGSCLQPLVHGSLASSSSHQWKRHSAFLKSYYYSGSTQIIQNNLPTSRPLTLIILLCKVKCLQFLGVRTWTFMREPLFFLPHSISCDYSLGMGLVTSENKKLIMSNNLMKSSLKAATFGESKTYITTLITLKVFKVFTNLCLIIILYIFTTIIWEGFLITLVVFVFQQK